MKNIQRRKSPQSQQVGSSSDAGKSGVEVEIERLRKERSVLMQEVVDLQQQQRATAHHAGKVNQRLQSAEQRQKQMVSFLAKLFQNPDFLARLKQQKKEQRDIESPRVKRKFVKQNKYEKGAAENLEDGQIVRYESDWKNITMSSETQELSPVSIEQSRQYLPQNLAREMSVCGDDLTSQIENLASDELAAMQGIMPTKETIASDPLFRGKNIMSPNEEVLLPEYFASLPEDLTMERGFQEFSRLGNESIIKPEDIWDPNFNVSVAVSSCENELWGNPMNYGVPDFDMSDSDIWDIGLESLSMDKWPVDDETDIQAGQPKDDRFI